MDIPIAWGELVVYDSPDGPLVGRAFEALPTRSMAGGVICGIIGIPGQFTGPDSVAVDAAGEPLIYATAHSTLDDIRPHQQAILVRFMALVPGAGQVSRYAC